MRLLPPLLHLNATALCAVALLLPISGALALLTAAPADEVAFLNEAIDRSVLSMERGEVETGGRTVPYAGGYNYFQQYRFVVDEWGTQLRGQGWLLGTTPAGIGRGEDLSRFPAAQSLEVGWNADGGSWFDGLAGFAGNPLLQLATLESADRVERAIQILSRRG